MKRIAVFVEGQTELITVREFLKKRFKWEVSINCMRLYGKSQYENCEHKWEGESEYHFSLFCTSGDSSVLAEILQNEESMWKAGYSKIIGLRDMFSEEYRKRSSTIDPLVNQDFISSHAERINQLAKKPNDIRFCFAIMEVESWYLGCSELFKNLDERITDEAIEGKLGLKLSDIDPETQFFHPVRTLEEILAIAGIQYDKSKQIVEKICAGLDDEHYSALYNKQICASFNNFIDSLLAA